MLGPAAINVGQAIAIIREVDTVGAAIIGIRDIALFAAASFTVVALVRIAAPFGTIELIVG